MEKTSRISGYYKLPVAERVKIVKEFADLSDEEEKLLLSMSALPMETADSMVENVVGVFQIPLGVATNFLINGRDYLIPMAIEETSVVAAASNAAKTARVKGGFTAIASDPLMIGQIQILNPRKNAVEEIQTHKEEILELANTQDKILTSFGGGAKDVEVRQLRDDMMCIHLIVDVRDAMGANAVNTMVEACAPLIQSITGGRTLLRILSNLADKRIVEAHALFDKNTIGGEKVVDDIIHAYEFASIDPYRAATHNKGIMNGIDAVVIATGNDWRAIEAGAHSFASKNGYTSLTTWGKNEEGDLVGTIKIPMAIGLIGGATKVHPLAQLSLKILNIQSAKELAEIIASVGLAQNFAAIRALATKGIQDGHMRLHAKNIAIMAGAKKDEIDVVAETLIKEKKIRMDRAKEVLEEIRIR
jgi:hydroxymethylglutaryl-CoA reductase